MTIEDIKSWATIEEIKTWMIIVQTVIIMLFMWMIHND